MEVERDVLSEAREEMLNRIESRRRALGATAGRRLPGDDSFLEDYAERQKQGENRK